MVALREGEIIEGKKNIELVKFKISNNEKVEDHYLSMSQSSMKRKSYSLNKLPSHPGLKDKSDEAILRKLSKR